MTFTVIQFTVKIDLKVTIYSVTNEKSERIQKILKKINPFQNKNRRNKTW